MEILDRFWDRLVDKAKRERKKERYVPNLWEEEVSDLGNLKWFPDQVFFVFQIWEVSNFWKRYKYANWSFKGFFSKMREILENFTKVSLVRLGEEVKRDERKCSQMRGMKSFLFGKLEVLSRRVFFENFHIPIFVFCLISEGLVDMEVDLLLTWRHWGAIWEEKL